jgi:hypothetical protein
MFLLDQIRQEAGFWNVSIAVVSILVIRLVLVRTRLRIVIFVFRGCIRMPKICY